MKRENKLFIREQFFELVSGFLLSLPLYLFVRKFEINYLSCLFLAVAFRWTVSNAVARVQLYFSELKNIATEQVLENEIELLKKELHEANKELTKALWPRKFSDK